MAFCRYRTPPWTSRVHGLPSPDEKWSACTGPVWSHGNTSTFGSIPFTYASFPSRIQNDIVGPYIFHRFETNALFLAVWQRQPLKHKQNLGVKSSPYSVHIFITAQQRMWLYSLFFTQKSLFASLPSHLASKSCFSKEERKNKDYTNGFQSPATWPLNNMCGTH